MFCSCGTRFFWKPECAGPFCFDSIQGFHSEEIVMKSQVKKLLGGPTALRIRHHSGALLRSTVARLEGPYKINQHLLENSAALLQSTIYAVESLQLIKNRVAALEQQNQTILAEVKKSRVVKRTGQYGSANPEIGLMLYLYAYLPSRNAIDVGANAGQVSERLLKAGYTVFAFEPFPPVFEKMRERLGRSESFHPMQVALGLDDRKMALHIAKVGADSTRHDDPTLYNSLMQHSMLDDLFFDGTTQEVMVRSLESLWRSAEIPEEIGLLKIDAEGYDLEVIRGMGSHAGPAVVLAEFWDSNFAFGKSGAQNRLEDLVCEMRQRRYHWHIVIYRTGDNDDISFYCNYDRSVENSWGNAFFFQDYAVFKEALQWCSAVLPQTYFTD
jgi:FkbM family methyltransferase